MKKMILLSLTLLLINHLSGQKSTYATAAIRQNEQLVVQAILDGDTNKLKQLWAPEFLVNTPRNVVANGRDAVFQVQRQGLLNYATFERVIESLLIRKKVAITMGHETYTGRTDLPEAKAGVPVKRRFTNVWVKQRGKWVQVGRHASVLCNQ